MLNYRRVVISPPCAGFVNSCEKSQAFHSVDLGTHGLNKITGESLGNCHQKEGFEWDFHGNGIEYFMGYMMVALWSSR
jgi:hypothetical protein